MPLFVFNSCRINNLNVILIIGYILGGGCDDGSGLVKTVANVQVRRCGYPVNTAASRYPRPVGHSLGEGTL